MAIVVRDTAGRFVLVNDAYLQLLGYSEEELRDRRFSDYTHPDDLEPQATLERELLAGTREDYRVDKRYYRKDGTQVWARLTVFSIRDAAGQITFVAGMVEDVTDRLRAQEDLRSSERTARLLFARSPIPMWVYDLDTLRF